VPLLAFEASYAKIRMTHWEGGSLLAVVCAEIGLKPQGEIEQVREDRGRVVRTGSAHDESSVGGCGSWHPFRQTDNLHPD
jgi:hypothetical protein